MLMEEGHAASMKSRSRGLSRCRTGSSCLMEEIHRDMGRSCACFFTLSSTRVTTVMKLNQYTNVNSVEVDTHLYALTTASGLLQAATST